MGNVINCDKCPATSTSTVFTFSEPLVLKLTEGVEPEPEQIKACQAKDLVDREWIERIQCIEEVHTQAYGLSSEAFDRLLSSVEKKLAITFIDNESSKEQIKECYKKHSGETIKCVDKVKQFVDEVDTMRLKTIKSKFTEPEK